MHYATDERQEKRSLARMLEQLRAALAYYAQLYEQTEDELQQLHRMYTSATPEFYNDIPAKEYLSAHYLQRSEDYEKALLKPYFGKLLYAEQRDGKDRQLYIGKRGVADYEKQEDIWIVDWRAPVSELYYSGTLGETVYQTPKAPVPVELKLKTTLDIQDGKLLGFYDSEVVANDDLLVKYLSKNKDVVLSEIIATIQKDQDQIIRRPLETQLLVQGVAGSGKTTVALHRIAYLLYAYREKLRSDQMLIIAANRLFLNYIGSMLPDLEVKGVQQGTLLETVHVALSKKLPKLRLPAKTESDYTDFDIIPELRRFCLGIKEECFLTAVDLQGIRFASRESLGEQLADLHEMSLSRMAQLLDARLWNGYQRNKDAYALPLHDFFFQKGITLRQELLREMKKTETALRQFFRSRVKKLRLPELLNRFRAGLGLGPQRPGSYTLDDLCILALLSNCLEDSCAEKRIRHIVIDEGQDLNALQYHCLKSMFPKASFTIVGDVMQNIDLHSVKSWEDVNDNVFGGAAEYATLLKSYRNTIEISDFAKRIVEQHTGQPFHTEPLARHGRAVQHTDVPKAEKQGELLRFLREVRQAGYGLNAVICKDKKTAQTLYHRLREKTNWMLLDAQSADLELGTYVLTVADAKGLEFDSVVIWDFDAYDIESDTLDYKLLYVAATRALHALFVMRN